jgi:hypothetical protein
MRISTRTHGLADYATGGVLLLAPAVLRPRLRRDRILLRAAGGAMLGCSALTDWEVGVRRVLPVPVHLALDAASGALMLTAPWLLGSRRAGARDWLPPLLLGATELGAAVLTEREPEDRDRRIAGIPRPPVGVHNPIAAQTPRGELGVPLAPPPMETPGPSVTAPRMPWSDAEREQWIDDRRPDWEVMDSRDPRVHQTGDPLEELIADEESAAAAEARAIGGFVPRDAVDPAMDPLYQAGEGDQDGWEEAERELRENASHGDGDGNPMRDMYSPELESDRAPGVYGEADDEYSSEVLDNPDEGPDDPGAGPGLTHDR